MHNSKIITYDPLERSDVNWKKKERRIRMFQLGKTYELFLN
jgi:hypothetical protein